MKIQKHEITFEEKGVSLLGISGDTIEHLDHLASRKGLNFPLAHVEDGKFFTHLGVFRKHSRSRGPLPYPSTLLFDREGILRWKKVTPGILRRTKPAELLEALASLSA